MIDGSVDHKTELHHRVPRCLLRLRDRAEAHAALDGGGLQLWMDYELEALSHGVDPDLGRDELARMVEESLVEVPADEHRAGHREARDFVRWGRRGGLTTLSRYGAGWFRLLGLRRWNRVGADALTGHLEAGACPERA